MAYAVPEGAVSDVTYTITPDNDGGAAVTDTLALNRPDVGIADMKLLRESDGTRDIQVRLNNASGIPLTGSGKTVKLALYKDSLFAERLGDEITVPAGAYADIDDGIYTHLQTLKVSDIIGGAAEIPAGGVRVYAKAWVEDVEEIYTSNNTASLSFKGLLTKYKAQMTMDTALLAGENNSYTVQADIRNNSLQSADMGDVTADILDDENHVLQSVQLFSALSLGMEETQSVTKEVTVTEGVPTKAALRSSTKSVALDAATNGGTCVETTLSLTKDGKPAMLPEAVRRIDTFKGWHTQAEGGNLVTKDTVLQGGDTIYAQFTPSVGNTVVLADYAFGDTPSEPKMDVAPTDNGVTVAYYWKDSAFTDDDAPDAGTAWADAKPVYVGDYYSKRP